MKRIFFMAASGIESGLTSISQGVFRALDSNGIRVGFCKPISQGLSPESAEDPSISLIAKTTGFKPATPISFEEAERFVRSDKMDDLMELIVEKVRQHDDDVDVMVLEGLLPTEKQSFPNRINRAAVTALDAEVILVNNMSGSIDELQEGLEICASLYGGCQSPRVLECILNKVQEGTEGIKTHLVTVQGCGEHQARPVKKITAERLQLLKAKIQAECPLFAQEGFNLIGLCPGILTYLHFESWTLHGTSVQP